MATTQEGLRSRWNTGREKFGEKFGEKLSGVGDKLGTVVNREKLGSVNVGKAERWASVLGGAALAALALRTRNRKTGLGVAALTGLPLLWRGATGHCPVYQKMGIDRTNGANAGTSLASDHSSNDSPALTRPTTPGLDEGLNPSQL